MYLLMFFLRMRHCGCQKRMAELFGVDRSVITKHLQNIFSEAELTQEQVCAKFTHTAEDGKMYVQ